MTESERQTERDTEPNLHEHGEHCAGSDKSSELEPIRQTAQDLAVRLLTEAALRWQSADFVRR